MKLNRTKYQVDFLGYYARADYLEQCNLYRVKQGDHSLTFDSCGDPLQDNVTIYDTIHRRYAGFSKVLEDLHERRPDRHSRTYGYDHFGYHYLHLVHRLTGSGASFQKDHGYRNSIVLELAALGDVSRMVQFIHCLDGAKYPRPIFTSIGNQIPQFPKPEDPYVRAGVQYLCRDAPRLAEDFTVFLLHERAANGRPTSQRDAMAWVERWQQKRGYKVFRFALGAWVMDTAEYFPDLVDPASLTHYGKNALETLELLFDKPAKISFDKFYDQASLQLCEELGAYPYDLEDILCDYVRYVENYVPKGYEHLTPDQYLNRSMIQDHPKRYFPGRTS